jgi:tRNA A37 N6-isopentenylltransferase MiaA
MADISARGRMPLLVGGTMLYFKALLEGLAELPQAARRLRAEIDAQAAQHGWPAVHAELAKVDPATAARLHPTDAQRVQRALEVFASRPPDVGPARRRQGAAAAYDFLSLGLLPSDRSVLHARIAERFRRHAGSRRVAHTFQADGLLEHIAKALPDPVQRLHLRHQFVLDVSSSSMRSSSVSVAWWMRLMLSSRRLS